MAASLAKIVWHGDSLDEIRSFPEHARQDVGYELGRVQQGLTPRDWKPMSIVGPGAIEIRVHAGSEYRVVYVTRRDEIVHVLHAFAKKTQKTRNADIELARRRYREMERRGSSK